MNNFKVGDKVVYENGNVCEIILETETNFILRLASTKYPAYAKEYLEPKDNVNLSASMYAQPEQPEKWYMVVYKIKATNKPFISSLLYTSVEDFHSSYYPSEGELEWVKLAEVKFNEE